MTEIKALLNEYANFIRSEISVAKIGEFCEITTPYLDRHNDYLQIYVKQLDDGEIFMTDDGFTISDLIASGVSIRRGSTREKAIHDIIRSFSLSLSGEDIVTTAQPETFAMRKHLMVQAMLQISDMYIAEPATIKDMFLDDVRMFMENNKVRYLADIPIVGKSGNVNVYPFVVAKSDNQPEWFIQAINKIDITKRNLSIFNWEDTKPQRRDPNASLMVFINDSIKAATKNDLQAYKAYNILPMPFSKREAALEKLGA